MKLRLLHQDNLNQATQPVTFEQRQNRSLNISNNPQTHRSIRFPEPEENSPQKDGLTHLSPSTFRTLEPTQRDLPEGGLNKSRGYQNNSRVANKKYQYGDEGVKVTEDVVQKYKASNYVIQRDMLQKFKREAEDFRRNRRPQKKNVPPYREREPDESWREQNTSSLQSLTFIQQQHQDNMKRYQYQLELLRRNRVIEEQQLRLKELEEQRLRERERRKRLRKAAYLKREKENLVNVGNMLRQINHKIQENSEQISSNLHRLREELNKGNKPRTKPIIIRNNKFWDLEEDQDSNFQSQQNRNKLPVILYNDRYTYSKSYVGDNQTLEGIERGRCRESADNIKNVVTILKRNERRIQELSSMKLENDN